MQSRLSVLRLEPFPQARPLDAEPFSSESQGREISNLLIVG